MNSANHSQPIGPIHRMKLLPQISPKTTQPIQTLSRPIIPPSTPIRLTQMSRKTEYFDTSLLKCWICPQKDVMENDLKPVPKPDKPKGTGRKPPPLKQGKPIKQFDAKGRYIQTFPSLAEAAFKSATSSSAIIANMKGKYALAGGYKWEYVNQSKEAA